MPMNVKPIPALDLRIEEIRGGTAWITDEHILPSEREPWALRRGADTTSEVHGSLIPKNVSKKYHSGESWDLGS